MYTRVILLSAAILVLAAEGRGEKDRSGEKGGMDKGMSKHDDKWRKGFNYQPVIACCPNYPYIIKNDSIQACKMQQKQMPESNKGYMKKHGGHDKNKFKNKTCIMECAFEKDSFIKTEGVGSKVIDLNNLNSHIKTFAVGEWEPVLQAAKEKCTTNAHAPKESSDKGCNSGSSKVAKCLRNVMLEKCPNYSSTQECTERLQKMRKYQTERAERAAHKGRSQSDS